MAYRYVKKKLSPTPPRRHNQKMHLQKTYMAVDISGHASLNIKRVKRLLETQTGTISGEKQGVFFNFKKGRVVVCGAIGQGLKLSYQQVEQTVSDVVGFRVQGKVVLQLYRATFTRIDSKVELALLHTRIAAAPPRGLVDNTLDFQVGAKLVVKMCPYQDGFRLTFRIDSKGAVEVLCDARPCEESLTNDVFRRRCLAVFNIITTL